MDLERRAFQFRQCRTFIDDRSIAYRAKHGKEVLDKISSGIFKHPDIIFLDINMPVMNGWQCLTELKKNEKLKDIPVVIFTTSTHKREAGIAMELNAFCFLTKPGNYNELKEILNVVVSNLNGELGKELSKFKNVICNGKTS